MRSIPVDKRGWGWALTAIQGDSRTQAVQLRVPRRANGVDLSGLGWAVNVQNAAGDTDVYALTPVIDDNCISLEWLIRGVACAAIGVTTCMLEGVGEDGDGNALVWQSGTGTITVKPATEATPSEDEERQLTALEQLIVYVGGELQTVIRAGQDAAEAAEAANDAAAAASGAAATANEAAQTANTAAAQVGAAFAALGLGVVDGMLQVVYQQA